MKKLMFIAILISISIATSAQSHRMKYYYDEEYECWNLEDSTNYRTNMPVVKPDGTPGDPRAALAKDETGLLDLELVKAVLTPDILARYKAQGLTKFNICYIILPNGTVDEVSFDFYGFKGKLNITESDMMLWRGLSDVLKQGVWFTIPKASQRLQFYRMGRFVFLSKLGI